jgi:hypothetical protein
MCCLMMCASPITCKPIVRNAARSACEICSRMMSACDIPGDVPHEGSALSPSELDHVMAEQMCQMAPSTAAASLPSVGYSLPVPAAAPAPQLAIRTLPPYDWRQPPVEHPVGDSYAASSQLPWVHAGAMTNQQIPPASNPAYQRPTAHPSWRPHAVYEEVGKLRM